MIRHVQHLLRDPTVGTVLRIAVVLKIEPSKLLRRAERAALKKRNA
jgi:hypothetical protein